MSVAIVTGASRGLGLALARALADQGWSLVIDARGADALAAVADELAERATVVAVPGDVRTQMHQEAFPGEDISDRPPPDVAVPGLLVLLEGDLPSGRYRAQELATGVPA